MPAATPVASMAAEDLRRAKREATLSKDPTMDPNLTEIFGSDDSDQDDDIQEIFRGDT